MCYILVLSYYEFSRSITQQNFDAFREVKSDFHKLKNC